MAQRVEIYDVTLRDGAQGPGVKFSSEDQLRIVQELDAFGVSYIEGGQPGSNPKAAELFQRAKDLDLKHAVMAAFGSTRHARFAVEDDPNIQALLAAGTPVVTIFAKFSPTHVTQILRVSLEENLRLIEESVAYLRSQGRRVVLDAEHFFDGYREDSEYALTALERGWQAGAEVLVLCDTNGGSMPWDIAGALQVSRKRLPEAAFGIHTHNDSGCGVANTLAAVHVGAVHVQGTINGYGERCGNANLCSIIPNLTLKCGLETIPSQNLAHLTGLSRFVSEVANVNPDTHQPFVGASAFAHKGGIHVSALLKDSRTYEHIPPERVGNQRRVLISELSGISNLLYKYKDLNIRVDHQTPEGRRVLDEIKQLENQGFVFESAGGSFELLLRKVYNGYKEPFTLETLRLFIEMRENNPAYAEAIIKMRVGEQTVHTAADGNGPVNALDNALRKALERFYPEIKKYQLIDYKVRVLDEKDGTGAMVRVHIETSDGRNTWGTVGVSENIIEASWQALVDSIAYGLLEREKHKEE